VRRHPHVFGEVEAETPGRVRANWEQIKRDQEGREGVFHDVPEALPSLAYARKVQRRAAAVGFDYAQLPPVLEHLRRELAELAEIAVEPSPESEPDPRAVDEVGDVLFSAVNVARRLNVDPELALRQTAKKFVARVERAVELAAAEDVHWTELPLAEQDRYYDLAKAERR
jgi:uncharacterized protein YabN with tetrapyrrole methylase and pyrophosphatase domain